MFNSSELPIMSSGQQFNLRWNNHTNNILQVFMEHLTSENLVDVTLSCQGQFLKAHKMILSACSPYFQELFRQHQVQHPVIIMNGMKFGEIKLVVEFMYRGEIKVLENELDGLLATAETLQVKGLSNVRNKYEKGDIQGNEQSSLSSRNDTAEASEQCSTLSADTPMHLRRKKRKRSNSPGGETIVTETTEKDGSILSSQKNSVSSPSNDKTIQPFVQVTMNDYVDDDDLPATIKVEPPDIRDIDEDESAGWESPKLVIDIPEAVEQGKSNSFSPKGNKILPKPTSSEFGKPCYGMEFPQSTPGTSQDNGSLAHQIMENHERKQVSQWLRKHTGKIPRPPNAFMIFANEWRRKLAFQHPTESNKEISVRLGIMWKNLSSDTKESYYAASRLADEEHKRKYPGYYYSPKEARLRKNLKHDLAMARKGTKSMEAMHLVKVLMADGNEASSPFVFLQDSSQQSQTKEQTISVGKKKSPKHSKQDPQTAESSEHSVGDVGNSQCDNKISEVKGTESSLEASSSGEMKKDIESTNEK